MNEFFAMGGHAAFIWPSWGLAALGVTGLIAFVLAERRAANRALKREEAERDAP